MKLPVSGMEVRFRSPDGGDDMATLEANGEPVEAALLLLPRLVELEACSDKEAGSAAECSSWAALTVTDFETALLGLRRFLLGDRVLCSFRCSFEDCGEPMQTEFSIAAFLAELKPAVPARVALRPDRNGWFRLSGQGEPTFRLPTVFDQLHVLGRPRAYQILAQRCVASDRLSPRELARVEKAMEAIAPLVSRALNGTCAACGREVKIALHVPTLVMDELRSVAAGIHEEIDMIASTYHWDESVILAMPQCRRVAYAETIRQRQRVAI